MSTRALRAFFLVAATALAPFGARAGDPPKADDEQKKGVLAEDVDFSKPPNLVEAYNKARIKASRSRDPKTGGLVIEVKGKAYYPDGVTFTIDARYWKHKLPFFTTHATVKDRAFTCKLGPFEHPVPGGELSIEAWFIASDQTPEARDRLTKGNYFHCSPPCHYDRRNVTRDKVELGGKDAQAQDEQVEKKEIEKARGALLDSVKVAGKVFDAVRSKEKTTKDAETALAQLDEDRKAALEAFSKFKASRQFLLFPDREGTLEKLAQWVKDSESAHAAVAGAKVKGVDPATAFTTYTRASEEVSKVADELKSFIDEKDSLDKAWDDLAKSAKERNAPTSSKAGGK